MATNNIIQQVVVPLKPKVIAEERIFVYMPTASKDTKGIASYNDRDFNITDGKVSLKWPVELLVEDLADPITQPSLVKVLPDEFIRTDNIVNLINPYTGEVYGSSTTEIKLNRGQRDPTKRPDLIMIDETEFTKHVELVNGEPYYKYKLKANNPLEKHTIVKLDPTEFEMTGDTVNIKWPKSAFNKYGVVKVGAGSKLGFDNNDNLIVTGLDTIESQIEALALSIGGLKSFLGIFNNIVEVENKYPADEILIGSTVYIVDTNSYWTVRDNSGYEWYDTTIEYVQDIGYVETTKHIHNWKEHPDGFIRSPNSNETYWAGSIEEFEQLDVSQLPNNSLFIVEEDSGMLAESYVLEESLKDSGFDLYETDLIVSVPYHISAYGAPMTLLNSGVNRKLEPLLYDPGKVLISDINGLIKASSIPTAALEQMDGILNLPFNRVMVTENNGDIGVTNFIKDNIVKTANGLVVTTLPTNKLLLSGLNNTIETWDGSIHVGSMIVTGDTQGTIKVRQPNALNRIMVTGINGSVVELARGNNGQVLASGGSSNLPGWIDLPVTETHTLQSVRYTNPTENEANAYDGLMAVILDTEPAELRNNCIYYIGG